MIQVCLMKDGQFVTGGEELLSQDGRCLRSPAGRRFGLTEDNQVSEHNEVAAPSSGEYV